MAFIIGAFSGMPGLFTTQSPQGCCFIMAAFFKRNARIFQHRLINIFQCTTVAHKHIPALLLAKQGRAYAAFGGAEDDEADLVGLHV